VKVFVYTNDAAEQQLFEGQSTGPSGGTLVVTAPTGTSGLMKNAKYKYSLTASNVNIKIATLTNIAGSQYTFSVS
jgi:hypothetical protein